ncbi:glycosyltransferase family 2 protein [Sedimentitalea sp. HM32M-2]|uniref:glycosyltransferase family 2 protein n=1 Tax=Sedimentitalea sp. HM32M-2 TaxID=3351566 RepID=UPI0036389BD0
MKPAAIIIGRNEGERFHACLASLGDRFSNVIYVDSGSTDGSIEAAQAAGIEVVHLDTSQPFTAARARNAGLERLNGRDDKPDFVQFIDGDCVLQPDWIKTATDFLRDTPQAAMVCGRRRERFPQASVYNHLIDAEWDTPHGQVSACGGDVLGRMTALNQVDGFNPDLIAGEEPELCLRLRAKGWDIWRIDAEMTLHDAAMTRFNQWWQRARRAGYTYAEGVAMYGRSPERYKRRELASALTWGLGLPLALLFAAIALTPWMLAGFLIYPLQVLRLRRRGLPWAQALFLTLGKFPETQGALTYGWRRLIGARARLIEYK